MDDLISRQAAIEMLDRLNCYGWVESAWEDVLHAIERVPSAQPEKHTEKRTETHARDCISRQAAIAHLKKRLYETEFNSTADYPYYKEIADNRVDVWMSEVPSAQTDLSEYSDRMRYAAYGLLPPVEPDLSEYSDKLWKAAYERGKAEALAEIVRCGDCKHWVCHDRRCGYWNHGVKPLDWCCHAERREG